MNAVIDLDLVVFRRSLGRIFRTKGHHFVCERRVQNQVRLLLEPLVNREIAPSDRPYAVAPDQVMSKARELAQELADGPT